MSVYRRKVLVFPNIEQLPPERPIVRYMPLWKFKSLVENSAIYFPRLDAFIDKVEGKIPAAVWELNSQAIKNWYNDCKERVYVNCWNLDEGESTKMWDEYAEKRGVLIKSTVEGLTNEFSFPPAPERALLDPETEGFYKKRGVIIDEVVDDQRDGFTLGKIKYIDHSKVDTQEMLQQGLSSAVPMFRKIEKYDHEQEFRAIMLPGSASGDDAHDRGQPFVLVPVRLEKLVHEIRFSPVDDASLEKEVREMLSARAINVPVLPSDLAAKVPLA